jgi:hypothetical protein
MTRGEGNKPASVYANQVNLLNETINIVKKDSDTLSNTNKLFHFSPPNIWVIEQKG